MKMNINNVFKWTDERVIKFAKRSTLGARGDYAGALTIKDKLRRFKALEVLEELKLKYSKFREISIEDDRRKHLFRWGLLYSYVHDLNESRDYFTLLPADIPDYIKELENQIFKSKS